MLIRCLSTELNLNEIQIYLRCKKHWHTLWVYILNLKFVAKYNRNLQTKILRKYTSINLTEFFSLSDLDSSSSDSIYRTTANTGAATTSTASTTSIYCTTTLLENAGSWKRSTRYVTGFIFFQMKIEKTHFFWNFLVWTFLKKIKIIPWRPFFVCSRKLKAVRLL